MAVNMLQGRFKEWQVNGVGTVPVLKSAAGGRGYVGDSVAFRVR
jgi:hypothetical protein